MNTAATVLLALLIGLILSIVAVVLFGEDF
jgi:uncharacterized membrane protein YgaE (UPF0421/DUF939 family)